MFNTSAWHDIEKIEDPELQELAKLLPAVVLSGRAPSTVKKYSGAFLRWKRWATQKYSEACFPPQPLQVALYLTKVIHRRGSSEFYIMGPSNGY